MNGTNFSPQASGFNLENHCDFGGTTTVSGLGIIYTDFGTAGGPSFTSSPLAKTGA